MINILDLSDTNLPTTSTKFHKFYFFFSSRRRHTRSLRDWSSDVCSSDLSRGGREAVAAGRAGGAAARGAVARRHGARQAGRDARAGAGEPAAGARRRVSPAAPTPETEVHASSRAAPRARAVAGGVRIGAMEAKNADLAGLRINRSPESAGAVPLRRAGRWLAIGVPAAVIVVLAVVLLKI